MVRLRPVWMTNHPPSVLWHWWLGHQTCKNRRPYNLYCVGADVKPCSIQSNARMSKITNDGLTRSGTGCFIAVLTCQQWVSKRLMWFWRVTIVNRSGSGWRRKRRARRSSVGTTDTGQTNHWMRWWRETGGSSRRITTSSPRVAEYRHRSVTGPRPSFRQISWTSYWRSDIR